MEPALQEPGKHGTAAYPDIPKRHTVTLQRAITVERGLIPPKEGIACFLKQHRAILNDVPSNLVNLKGFHYRWNSIHRCKGPIMTLTATLKQSAAKRAYKN